MALGARIPECCCRRLLMHLLGVLYEASAAEDASSTSLGLDVKLTEAMTRNMPYQADASISQGHSGRWRCEGDCTMRSEQARIGAARGGCVCAGRSGCKLDCAMRSEQSLNPGEHAHAAQHNTVDMRLGIRVPVTLAGSEISFLSTLPKLPANGLRV
ncbi:hypothetical protein C8R44DRAFT_740906 [Mycena epipterygia]|nr:hypothetical protein C8R44DRAFT_740906 [Mycena epipterygia]